MWVLNLTVATMKITDVAPQKNNKNRVSVFVDGEYAFSLDSADALRLGVKVDAEITEKDIEIYNLESNLSKAKSKAFDIVSRKAVTEKGLRDALFKKGYDKVIVDIVVDTMQEYNYINDFDFCESFFEYAKQKGWGILKIKSELKRRGVSEVVMRDALSQFSDSPKERIYDIMCRKFDGADTTDIKQKQKILRFFASRGFDYESTMDALGRFVSENKDR